MAAPSRRPLLVPLFQNAMSVYQAGFEYDALHDQLPTVSWVIPTSYQSEHPDFLPAAGADFIASKLDAIAADPSVWEKTVFVLVYDENDGLFDHVTPPTPRGHPWRMDHRRRHTRPDRARVPGALHSGLALD